MKDEPGTRGYAIRQFCLDNIAADLASGLSTEEEGQVFTNLVNYFTTYTFSSMSDMLGAQLLAERWKDRPGWVPEWQKTWPCCDSCAVASWRAGRLTDQRSTEVICAGCGRPTKDASYYIILDAHQVRTETRTEELERMKAAYAAGTDS